MPICRRHFNLSLLGGASARLVTGLSPSPKLLVLVLLEQMRQDYWDSAAAQFGPGGLRRILSKGAHFPDCRHLASSFSASTIATLATGAWPTQHGIVADSWYDRAARSYQESATMPCCAGQAPVARVAMVEAEKLLARWRQSGKCAPFDKIRRSPPGPN